MLDGRVLEASQVEYKPFGKPPLQRESRRLSKFLVQVPWPNLDKWLCKRKTRDKICPSSLSKFLSKFGSARGCGWMVLDHRR